MHLRSGQKWGLSPLHLAAIIALSASCAPATRAQGLALGDDCIAAAFLPGETPTSFAYGIALEEEESEVGAIVRRIQRVTGLSRRVTAIAAEIRNACAMKDHQQRPVIYVGEDWLDDYSQGSYWVKVGVLAHELGHHFNGHDLKADGLITWQREYEADEFVGNVVYRLGGTLEDALLGVSKQPYDGTQSHPPRAAREAAVRSGYDLAAGVADETATLDGSSGTFLFRRAGAQPPVPVDETIDATVAGPVEGDISATLPTLLPPSEATLFYYTIGSAFGASPLEYSGETKWSWKSDENQIRFVSGVTYFPDLGVMVVIEFHRAIGTTINLGFSFSAESKFRRADGVGGFAISGRPIELLDDNATLIGANQFRVVAPMHLTDPSLSFAPRFDTGHWAIIALGKNNEVIQALADTMQQ